MDRELYVCRHTEKDVVIFFNFVQDIMICRRRLQKFVKHISIRHLSPQI